MQNTQRLIALLLILSFITVTPVFASTETFDNIEYMQANGDKMRETSVKIVFDDKAMRVVSRSKGTVLKEWNYETIKIAEYSYTKNPRWKTGLGLTAASVVFPLLWIVTIPIGFTKHRRHWVTIRTDDDFAVLKVGKGIRKVFIPAFETRTNVPITALGDDK
jgi:hypothetical protein